MEKTEPTVVCVVDVAQRAQDWGGLPVSLSLRREMLDGIPHFRFVTDPVSILITERSFNILFAASKTNYVGPKSITPAKRCDNCNGTGAEHDPDVRAFACTKCSGSGMVECFGVELGEAPKESPLPERKEAEKGDNSFGEELLDAGYDNGFGVTSLDTLLCEQMSRAERLDFAAFLMRTAQEHFISSAIPEERK